MNSAMSVANSTEVYVSTLALNRCFRNMETLWKEGKLCDITLKVDDHVINAHRIVLAATIPFFQVMFNSNMLETHQNDVNMLGIEFDALESFVNYAYRGRLNIDSENVASILAGASFLMLDDIEKFCVKFLMKRINPGNALEIKSIADRFEKSDLRQAAINVIKRKFYYVTQSCAFKSLDPRDQFKLRRIYGYVPHLRLPFRIPVLRKSSSRKSVTKKTQCV